MRESVPKGLSYSTFYLRNMVSFTATGLIGNMYSFLRQACYVRKSVPKSLSYSTFNLRNMVSFSAIGLVGNMSSFLRQACYVRESVLKSLPYSTFYLGNMFSFTATGLVGNMFFFFAAGLIRALKRTEKSVVFNLLIRKYIFLYCGRICTKT